MNVTSVVSKYIIKDLTGLIEDYYIQERDWRLAEFGCWKRISCRVERFDNLLNRASYGGHLDMVKYFESEGANNWRWASHGASYRGHLHVIKYAETKDMLDWNWVLYNASLGGHLHVVKYAESKGANEWKQAMAVADEEDTELVDYIQTKLN